MQLRQSRSLSTESLVFEVTGVGDFYELQNARVCSSCGLGQYCTGPNLRGNPMITISVRETDRAFRQVPNLENRAGCKDI